MVSGVSVGLVIEMDWVRFPAWPFGRMPCLRQLCLIFVIQDYKVIIDINLNGDGGPQWGIGRVILCDKLMGLRIGVTEEININSIQFNYLLTSFTF
jgi:hypothetical protein